MTPAHEDESLAGADAVGELLGGDGHGAMAGDVGFILIFIEGDDFVAARVVAMVFDDEGIAEDGVGPVDVDDGFARARFSGGSLSFVAETDACDGGAPLSGVGRCQGRRSACRWGSNWRYLTGRREGHGVGCC